MIPDIDLKVPFRDYSGKLPGDWFMTAYERRMLAHLVSSIEAATVIETGVQDGNAALNVLRSCPTVQWYVGIDVEAGYVPSMVQQINEVPASPGWLVRGDHRFNLLLRPRGSLDLEPRDLPPCDLFLVDGDHGREAVFHDTRLARSSVRKGGIILWHDYNEECVVDVKQCVEEMRAFGADIRRIPNTWFAVQYV